MLRQFPSPAVDSLAGDVNANKQTGVNTSNGWQKGTYEAAPHGARRGALRKPAGPILKGASLCLHPDSLVICSSTVFGHDVSFSSQVRRVRYLARPTTYTEHCHNQYVQVI